MERPRCLLTVILLNITHAIAILVLIFHLIIRDSWIYQREHIEKESTDQWWILRFFIQVLAFAVVNIQVSIDVILIKNLQNPLSALLTCRHWVRMSTAFQVVQIIGFYLSIFYRHTHGFSLLVLFLALSSFVIRALGLYKVNQFLIVLEKALPATLEARETCFITLAPEFYRSKSEISDSSIAPSHF